MKVEEVVKKVKIEDIVTVDVPIRMVRDKGYAVDKVGQWKAVTVYTREQTFHDFKTKEGGNVLKWLQYFHGMTYDDALREICRKAAVNTDDLFYFQKLAREAAMPAPMPKAKPIVEAVVKPSLQADYPCTIAWPDGEKTYPDEFSLLVDALNRAPDLVSYAKVLRFAKPAMLKALPHEPETWPEFEEWKKSIACNEEATHFVEANKKVSPVVAKAEQVTLFELAGGGHYYE